MPIYTKKGDKGKTQLLGSVSRNKLCISKDSLEIEALGSLDELSSFLGIVISFSNIAETTLYLKEVQRDLFVIGSIVAGSKISFTLSKTKKIERTIDKLEKNLPSLSKFILPGGTVLASHLHYARSLARKSERVVVKLSRSKKVKPQVLAYLNRLSDLFYILARFVNNQAEVKEEAWQKKK